MTFPNTQCRRFPELVPKFPWFPNSLDLKYKAWDEWLAKKVAKVTL